ncbi:MAG: hypothetical protein NTW21_36835 [Verrucomicrobia bacterium]|nr:hypothetical protein [Verrucomicrobiota bacterium]
MNTPPIKTTTSFPPAGKSVRIRFPWKFVLFALATQVACHAFGMETWKLARELLRAPVGLLLLIGLAAMLVCAAFVVRQPYVGLKRHWMLAWLAILGSAWMTTSTHEMVHNWGWGLLAVAVVAILLLKRPAEEWLEDLRHFENVAPPPEEATTESSQLPRLIVLLLSVPNATLPIEIAGSGPVDIFAGPRKDRKLTLNRVSLDDDVLALEKLKEESGEGKKDGTFFNWQQQLRALRSPGFANVAEVVFVGSKQKVDYCAQAKQFFKPYLPNASISSIAIEQFADYNSVQNTLMELIRVRKVEPGKVVIDFTGGFAASSVAAALFTVRGGTRIQWVPTPSQQGQYDPDVLNKMPFLYDIRQLIEPVSIG